MVRLRRTGRGPELVEVPPERCPNGHPLVPPNVQVTLAINPAGRRVRAWQCWTCDTLTYDED